MGQGLGGEQEQGGVLPAGQDRFGDRGLVAQRLARSGAGGQGHAPAGPEPVDRLRLVDVEPLRTPGRQPFEHVRVQRLLRLAVAGDTGRDHVEARQAGPDVGVGGEGVQGLDRVHSKGEGTLALWH